MSTKLIVVIGATGLQGGSVARHFASLPNWRVRAITRDPSKPSATALRDQGIDEVVAADLDDPTSLNKAFAEANVIFANTDFWQFLQDSTTFEQASKAGKLPNQIAYDLEVQQGKNAVDAAASHADNLDLFIWSTLSDTKKWTQGAIEWNLHFDSKAAVAAYIRSDAHAAALANKTSYLQVGMYLQNWKMNPALRPEKRADGSFALSAPKVMETFAAPLVDPAHDTGLFVEALVNSPAGSAMLGYARETTYGDYWRLWAKIQGVKLEILDEELDFGEEMPKWLKQEFRDAFRYCFEYGFAGGDPEVKGPEAFGADMGRMTDLEEWIRREDWSSIL